MLSVSLLAALTSALFVESAAFSGPSSERARPVDENPCKLVTLLIDKNNELIRGGASFSETELENLLLSQQDPKEPRICFMLTVDGDASHRMVVDLYDRVQAAGVAVMMQRLDESG
jgi:biopolymer transport protein ExbD